MITSSQIASITDASSDLIGTSAILYHAGHHIPASTVASRERDLDNAFRRIADALGYSVSKINPALAVAAE